MPRIHDRDIANASALFRCGKAEAACKEFERILGNEPGNVPALHGLGLSLHAIGNLERAMISFQHAIALDPFAWLSWQSIADLTPDEVERCRAIDQAADILLAVCRSGKPSPRIVRETVRALVCAERPHQALHLLQEYFRGFEDELQAHALLAATHYSIGQFEAAAHHQYLARPQAPAAPPADVRSAYEPDRAMEVLVKLCSMFEAAGFRPFLIAGTLLGLVRSGSLLEHDRDIDIGLMRGENGGRDPIDFIRTHPKLILPRSARPGDRYVGLILDGIAADIFVFDKTPNGLVCGFSSLPGDIQWCHSPFRPQKIRLGGHDFRIPDPAETYLSECYGSGWRVPDPGFASALSSPVLHGTSPHAIAYLALARARICLLTGDSKKAAALLQQIPQVEAQEASAVAGIKSGQTTPAFKRQV